VWSVQHSGLDLVNVQGFLFTFQAGETGGAGLEREHAAVLTWVRSD
jgi:hypothetical protein